MSLICIEQGGSPLLDNLVGFPVMDHLRRQQAKPVVIVFGVIPREKLTAERASILDTSKAPREIGVVLHRLEL